MKLEICSFSGYKIYPGHGKIYVRQDNRTFRFIDSKTASLFLQRKNPRKIHWTVVFRRAHRKGITEEVAKRRTRRTVKHQRAIVGASMEFIKARRNQRPAARATAQSEAIKKAKAEKAAKATKAEKSKSAKAAHAPVGTKFSKQQQKGAQQKVIPTSR